MCLQPNLAPHQKSNRDGKVGRGVRFYSTAETSDFAGVVKYCNVDVDKLRVLSDNKAKCGIYMFTHTASGKRYIGSSVDLRRRFLEYYNTKRLLITFSMRINRALLKYGYSAFSLDILAYCDKSELMRKEKYFIDLFEPEYNILNDPGSPSRGSG